MVRPIHLFLSTRYVNESQQNKKKQKTIYRLCPRGLFLEYLLVTIFHISFARVSDLLNNWLKELYASRHRRVDSMRTRPSIGWQYTMALELD
jgi:hypothetical protein